jgi:hypothetical protein
MSGVIKLTSSSFVDTLKSNISYDHEREKLVYKNDLPFLLRIPKVEIQRVYQHETTCVIFGKISETTFKQSLLLNDSVMSIITNSNGFQSRNHNAEIVSNTSFFSVGRISEEEEHENEYIIRMEVDCSEEVSCFFENTDSEVQLTNVSKYKEMDVVGSVIVSVDEIRLECNLSFVIEEAHLKKKESKRKPKYLTSSSSSD